MTSQFALPHWRSLFRGPWLRYWKAVRPLIIGFVGVVCLGSPSNADELERVIDPELVEVLANVTVLKNVQPAGVFLIRIFRTTDAGECDPNREAKTCPHSRLYILSGRDGMGLTEPKLWRTERRIGWVVQDIRQFEADDHGFVRTIVSATACEASPEVESGKVNPRIGGWWVTVSYKIEITRDSISTIREPPGSLIPVCQLY